MQKLALASQVNTVACQVVSYYKISVGSRLSSRLGEELKYPRKDSKPKAPSEGNICIYSSQVYSKPPLISLSTQGKKNLVSNAVRYKNCRKDYGMHMSRNPMCLTPV